MALVVRGGAALVGNYRLDDGDTTTPPVEGEIDPSVFFDVSIGILF
jgi:hypothetical protein